MCSPSFVGAEEEWELVAAPLLRYPPPHCPSLASSSPRAGTSRGSAPVYHSHLVVRADSDVVDGKQLAGRVVAVNDKSSLSGFHVLPLWLADAGLAAPGAPPFFSKAVRSGGHANSLRMVASGDVDCAAIDCNMIGVLQRVQPALLRGVKLVGGATEMLANPVQPLVMSKALPASVKCAIRAAFERLHGHAAANHGDVPPAVSKCLQALGWRGFVTNPVELKLLYAPLRAALAAAPPFAAEHDPGRASAGSGSGCRMSPAAVSVPGGAGVGAAPSDTPSDSCAATASSARRAGAGSGASSGMEPVA